MARVYLALGSNIKPEKNLPAALEALMERFGGLLACSSLWRTAAVGSDGPDFINAVVLVETHLNPEKLKFEVLRPLEAKMGRVRVADKNAPRPIDIDVLIYEGKLLEAELWERVHLAAPLAEIWPEYRNTEKGETVKSAAERLMEGGRIEIFSRQRNKKNYEIGW
jgi:2-amino-4-hydroxy-6-hydroxymethyldihydropteridine diphosphokinase